MYAQYNSCVSLVPQTSLPHLQLEGLDPALVERGSLTYCIPDQVHHASIV